MSDLILILEFFGGVVLLFLIGFLISRATRLDKTTEEMLNANRHNGFRGLGQI